MGITIQYRGRINKRENVEKLADELEDFSRQLGWKSKRWDNDWTKPNTTATSYKDGTIHIKGHVPLKGLSLFPHLHCEPFSLTFTPEGWLVDVVGMSLIGSEKTTAETFWMGTKTQFAPLETHITVVKLLEYLKKRYIHNLEVHDDGGYWETGDIDELKCRRDSINRGIDMLEDALSEIPSKNMKDKSPEEIAEMIERIFKSFGENDD